MELDINTILAKATHAIESVVSGSLVGITRGAEGVCKRVLRNDEVIIEVAQRTLIKTRGGIKRAGQFAVDIIARQRHTTNDRIDAGILRGLYETVGSICCLDLQGAECDLRIRVRPNIRRIRDVGDLNVKRWDLGDIVIDIRRGHVRNVTLVEDAGIYISGPHGEGSAIAVRANPETPESDVDIG